MSKQFKQIVINIPEETNIEVTESENKIIITIVNGPKVIKNECVFSFDPRPEIYSIAEMGIEKRYVEIFNAKKVYTLDKLFECIYNGKVDVGNSTIDISGNMKANIIDQLSKVGITFIDMSKLPTRVATTLERAKIYTNQQLANCTPNKLLRFRNIGERSIEPIKEYLLSIGLSLKED